MWQYLRDTEHFTCLLTAHQALQLSRVERQGQALASVPVPFVRASSRIGGSLEPIPGAENLVKLLAYQSAFAVLVAVLSRYSYPMQFWYHRIWSISIRASPRRCLCNIGGAQPPPPLAVMRRLSRGSYGRTSAGRRPSSRKKSRSTPDQHVPQPSRTDPRNSVYPVQI